MGVVYCDSLPNKPLVEAILEVKWGDPGLPDPAYPMIVGRLYESVKAEYGVVEDLELAQFPPGLAVHVPRHRFRVGPNEWPLVQIGPGVAALNDTQAYTWQDFRRRALDFFPRLKKVHPDSDELRFTSVKLQYFDAIEFDFRNGDVKQFLRDKLHLQAGLPDVLFSGQPIERNPMHAALQLGFATSEPKGRIQLGVSTGHREDKPAVILDTAVASVGEEAEGARRDFESWLDSAHSLIHHWFFALIQGDLLEEFQRS